MLVYGDPHFTAQFQALRARLAALGGRAAAMPHDAERLRHLLNICVQGEQGLHDALATSPPSSEAGDYLTAMHRCTAQAAAAFYACAWRQPDELPLPTVVAEAALDAMRQALDMLHDAPDAAITVKLPEGFSVHALYPEQYLLAAGQWLADHRHQRGRGATVVGVRSIGTTLAAVVATVLRAGGWQVHSFTVRPTGHPYARAVNLPGVAVAPRSLGLIVDEGPGISGSSMAAVAEALVAAGLTRRNIAFLPGHSNEPGGAGGEAVQRWWKTAPRYVGDAETVRFGGRPLRDALGSILQGEIGEVEDFSGGLWRRRVYPENALWPAVCTHFERAKYRYTQRNGSRALFKFLGLAALAPDLRSTAETAALTLDRRSSQGLAPPVVAQGHGFVATGWIEGEPLSAGAAGSVAAAMLGAYIARVAGPPLAHDEWIAGCERLAAMLVANTREALGEAAAQAAQQIRRPAGSPDAAYGDGRLPPHEWIAVAGGRVCKVDGVGHECDHTLVGRQSVAWDLAGAMVEWRLGSQARARLLAAYEMAGGQPLAEETSTFFEAAYLAFRTGQCALAAQFHDPYERERLAAASQIYCEQLARLLRR